MEVENIRLNDYVCMKDGTMLKVKKIFYAGNKQVSFVPYGSNRLISIEHVKVANVLHKLGEA